MKFPWQKSEEELRRLIEQKHKEQVARVKRVQYEVAVLAARVGGVEGKDTDGNGNARAD